MSMPINSSNRPIKWRLLSSFFLFGIILNPAICLAHQAPTTNILLDVNTKMVAVELQIPIPELQLSFGNDISQDPENIVALYEPQLAEYLKAHIHPYVNKEKPWAIEIVCMNMDKGTQVLSGPPFWELRVHLNLLPNKGEDTRNFTLDYDVVMHQVINHAAMVSIRNDWENGVITDNPIQVGVISRDIARNTIKPFAINLQKGSIWKGFTSMFWMGVEHIKTGTDHLLFIITLLLPACLLVKHGRWTVYGGWKYSLFRLLKVITAFTIGHSITLLVGALGFVKIPTQVVEVVIAISILVSAIHAIKPLFYGKEVFIALGFGFIHGLAFSQTLQNLHLVSTDLALSVLGFNLGIEAMQITVIAITIPWFILMSKSIYFNIVKNVLASLVSIAAIGWIVQRTTGVSNFLSNITDQLLLFSPWLVIMLCILSFTVFALTKYSKRPFIN